MVKVEDGVKLEVLDWGGTGRPIVLLAGMGNTAYVFDDFAPKLTQLGHVYGITRRGFGSSSRPDPASASAYRAERLGDDVLAVLHDLDLETPILIGHSVAGSELSFMASEHADRISGVVYLDAAYRYAYNRPALEEAATALRVELENLIHELAETPPTGGFSSPEFKNRLAATLHGDTLDDFKREFEHETALLPPFSPSGPKPKRKYKRTFTAFRDYLERENGWCVPEAELRQLYATNSKGRVGRLKNLPAVIDVMEAIHSGFRTFTEILVPALAIYAYPIGLDRWKSQLPDAPSWVRSASAETHRQADAFRRGVPPARVVHVPNAVHYLFLSADENTVLQEIETFIATVP